MKPHLTLSSTLRKSNNPIDFAEKRDLVYQTSCRDCDSVYIGKTGRCVKTRKKKHAGAVKNFDPEKSALSQHV